MRQNQTLTVREQLSGRSDATRNHEDGLAFVMDAKSRLYTRVCASFFGEPKYYTDGNTSADELRADVKLAAASDPEFVLRLAAFARQEMHLRTTPQVVLAEAASIPVCKPFVRKWTPEIVRRADEPAEVIAYWTKQHGPIGSHGKPGGEHAFPNSLTRGLEDALARFGEYQFAKYDRDGAVKLRDVLRIVRPHPGTPERSALYRYLVKGELNVELLPLLAAKAELLRKEEFDAEARVLADRAHATWEVLVSKFGSRPEVWNAIDFPFMAGLRNIANFMRVGAAEALDRVIAMLRDPDHVRMSHQLPFRFYSAYRVVEGLQHPRQAAVLEAILAALDASVTNLPRLPGRTFVTMDNSGSMRTPLSERSTVQFVDVCNLLGAIAHTSCEEAICSVFGTGHEVVPIVRKDSILTNMARLRDTDVDCSTNAYLAVKHLRETRTRVDRIILLSDMQCYDTESGWCGADGSLAEELRKYRSSVNPEVYMYSVDLAGYGTSQFPADERRVALLSGWSEKLLSFIPLFEGDGVQAVDRIARWEPNRQRIAETPEVEAV